MSPSPLRDDYLPPIDAFIAALGEAGDIEYEVGPMSTRIHGDYDRVMAVVDGGHARVCWNGTAAPSS
ncbi:MAG: thiamine-binding protein [Gammaproteobacteria bacterium]|nr:thiamine-binding protein [Gammaproteobacteria bacterium]